MIYDNTDATCDKNNEEVKRSLLVLAQFHVFAIGSVWYMK